MARAFDAPGRGQGPERLPPQIVAILRPEIPALIDDIVGEIGSAIPEFVDPGREPRAGLRAAAEQALATFMDLLSGSTDSVERRDELCRALGRREAHEGRSMDALQAAYRTGVQVAWRRATEVGRRRGLSSAVMSRLADAAFSYIDELATLSVEGYMEAKARSSERRVERHRLLLDLVLKRPAVARAALVAPAEEAGWDVPDEVTMVALPAQARCLIEALDPDVLADAGPPDPILLVPGPLDRGRRAMLAAAIPERRAAAGLTVLLEDARDSLRWARQALALVDAGILEDDGLVVCEDHLLELWLLSDGALLDQIARRRLARMARLSRTQHGRLTETLGAWLETQGNAVDTARILQVHPQTVRYRMRQVSELFGAELADADSRFTLELVLRADRLRRRRTPPPRGVPP
ncbi:PucR family transcriptional regulator [Spirillospora sp. CA-294931]|uniref:PucR family transcriptional regulator n=1 Tax=Spirillospora sp. CA-294931 TaxID=3240042 RepID=UPI003D935BE1